MRSIFLECNGISKIENLEVMPQLVSLYLQSNCITRMENLDLLSNLQYLNLSHNSISEVQNLGTLSIWQAVLNVLVLVFHPSIIYYSDSSMA